jgi:hypothetical protein
MLPLLARDFRSVPLDSRPAPAEDEEEDHDQQDQVESATAVVADARSHVVTAPADQQEQDYQNNYQHRQSPFPSTKLGHG